MHAQSSNTMTQTSNIRRDNKKAKAQSKFCGVCHKAGRPESEYTGHFTKTEPGPKGKTVCPLILNNECNYCFQKGHFKSACPSLTANIRENKRYERRNSYQRPVECCKKAPAPINRGGFAALDVDSDEEIICVKRKLPVAGPKPVSAAILAETQANLEAKPSFASVLLLKPEAPVPANKPKKKDGETKKRISWADWDDYSDDEEYEETECTDSWEL